MRWIRRSDLPLGVTFSEQFDRSRSHLRQQGRAETRDRILAGQTFGFWAGLLGKAQDELRRVVIHRAFRPGTARPTVAGLAERVRQTRNRVAHQNYVRSFDIPRAVNEVFELARCISPGFAQWMEERSAWREVYDSCPEIDVDTVVVAGKVAWDVYSSGIPVYVCRPGRYFREVEHLAFYENQSVRAQVPAIRHVFAEVAWNPEQADIYCAWDADDAPVNAMYHALGKAMRKAFTPDGERVSEGWGLEAYKVFLLTPFRPEDRGADGHRVLPADVPHATHGRGSAFTQQQRYVSLHRLLSAKTTQDLVVDPASPDDRA